MEKEREISEELEQRNQSPQSSGQPDQNQESKEDTENQSEEDTHDLEDTETTEPSEESKEELDHDQNSDEELVEKSYTEEKAVEPEKVPEQNTSADLEEGTSETQSPEETDSSQSEIKSEDTSGSTSAEDTEISEVETEAKEPELPQDELSGSDVVTKEQEQTEDISDVESEKEAGKDEADEDQKESAEDEHHDEDDDDEEEIDYSELSKEELYRHLESAAEAENVKALDFALKNIKPAYTEIYLQEKEEAQKKFVQDGGLDEDFNYMGDDMDNKIHATIYRIREKKSKILSEQEKNKEQNLEAKNLVLEKLRALVDSEETNASITALKKIQDEFRSIGPVPPQFVKSLWANYSALIDRFYDKRSIYFELKELDRKKNLEAKNELVDRAEKLVEVENLKEAIKELNELHEEFKHIGPVPKDDQEPLWLRFKAASDEVYARRKVFVDNLKKDLKENADQKIALGEQAEEFSSFDSDRISEWNAKTKEILDLQKKWEAIGGVPRDRAKQINKRFWSAFKKFFNNKNAFFKRLEGMRVENLKKKEALLEKAQQLKESDDFESTANTLKDLQKEWKNIGPVPEKQKEEVYKKFKAACDEFFNRRRQKNRATESEYEDNLKRKEEICAEIELMAQQNSSDLDKVEELQAEFNEVGFVPRTFIKTIQNRFTDALNKFIESSEGLDDEEKEEVKMSIQLNKIKSGPNANKKFMRKESALRNKITELENDITLWKNNMEFFAESKTADKLKEEFNEKIGNAREEIKQLKKQLKLIRTF